MSAFALAGDVFRPQRRDGMGRGLALALLAHVLLILVLAVGVNWRTTPEREGAEAELWAAVPQVAAPRAAAQEPAPAPPSPPQTAPRVEPRLRTTMEPETDAQIAIEKDRRDERKKLEKQQELAEKREVEKAAKAAKAEALAALKAEKLAAKLAEQKAQKTKAEQQVAQQQELAASAATSKKKELAAQKLEAQREANLQRMLAQAGSGEAASPGRAAQSAGPSADYIGRIKGRIRPNVAFPNTLAGNPAVEVELRLAADGRILSTRIIKPSGSREWDEAVQRGIEKTEMLPRDESGKAPPSMIIEYRPRD